MFLFYELKVLASQSIGCQSECLYWPQYVWGPCPCLGPIEFLSPKQCSRQAEMSVGNWIVGATWLVFTWNIGAAWWRYQMETFSALLAICAGNSPVPGEFITQRPVTQSFDIFFDLRLNKRLSKQSWGWWLETLSRQLWRHRNGMSCQWNPVRGPGPFY